MWSWRHLPHLQNSTWFRTKTSQPVMIYLGAYHLHDAGQRLHKGLSRISLSVWEFPTPRRSHNRSPKPRPCRQTRSWDLIYFFFFQFFRKPFFFASICILFSMVPPSSPVDGYIALLVQKTLSCCQCSAPYCCCIVKYSLHHRTVITCRERET